MSGLRPEIRFLLFSLLVNAICFGIIVPVTPDLVMELGHADASQASAIGGLLALAYALFQFVFGPVMGNLSDAIGRRPVLLASLAGFAIDFIIMALAPNLVWLFAARILTGICGASNAPAQSSIADLVTPENRGRIFGLLSAAFGLGFVIGPAIGGWLGEYGHRTPFYAAAGLASLTFIWGFFAFHETHPPENRRPFAWKRANPVGALLDIRRFPGLMAITLVYFLWQLSSLVYPMIWSYFTKSAFDWSPGMIGLSLAQIGIGMVLVNIFVTPRLIPRLGERKTALVGIATGVTGMILYALATSTTQIFLIGCLMPLQSLVHPALTAMMSRVATADSQGEVQGVASSAMALGSVFAPLIFNPVHAWFISEAAPFRFDGAPMIVAAVVGVAAGLSLLLLVRSKG